MEDELNQILRDEGYEGWEVEDDSVIVCPHGYKIEWDGMGPDGCISPLTHLGLI